MNPTDTVQVDVISAFVILVTVLVFLWGIVPTELSLASTLLLSQIAGAIGALLWVAALWKLKKWGLEPDSTDPFGGGPNEARLAGGACMGLVYFLPIAASLAFVDIQLHADSPKTAVLTNCAFLLGSTIGAAAFYGSGIRSYVSNLEWSHLKQETALVVIWSGLIVGIALAFYVTVSAMLASTSIVAALRRAALASFISVLLSYLVVFVFESCCVTPAQPRQDIRGVFVGIILMWSITVAHEISRSSLPVSQLVLDVLRKLGRLMEH